MGTGRSALGLAVALLAVAAVPSAVLGTGVSQASATACGSLSLGTGNPAGGGELSDTSFVSAGEWWAVGDVGAALHANRTLITRFNGSAWSVVSSPNQGTANNGLNGVSIDPNGNPVNASGVSTYCSHQSRV